MKMIVGLAMSLGALIASPAAACALRSPFKAEFVDYADTVIEGRPTSYELLARDDNRKRILSTLGVTFEDIKTERLRRALLGTYAVVEIEVDKTHKGSSPDSVTVFWPSGTVFGLPEELDSRPRIFALIDPESSGAKPHIMFDRFRLKQAKPKSDHVFFMLQHICAPAFVLDLDWEDAAKVRERLKGS